jgi:hypothetical protein
LLIYRLLASEARQAMGIGRGAVGKVSVISQFDGPVIRLGDGC